jgi:hypothetical protein
MCLEMGHLYVNTVRFEIQGKLSELVAQGERPLFIYPLSRRSRRRGEI